MTDVVLKAIKKKTLTKENISFKEMHGLAARDCSVRDQLDRGRAVLHNTNQLDQYLFTYGRMVQSQWRFALDNYNIPITATQIIDYACGQGLGSMFLIESALSNNATTFQKITLIDPSTVALDRAESVIRCYQTDTELQTVNKYFEDIPLKELQTNNEQDTLHVFSNILDINEFNLFHLTDLVANNPGRHHFIAVSNDRDVHGGLHRVLDFPDALKQGTTDFQSEWQNFKCENGMSAVFLQGSFSVR